MHHVSNIQIEDPVVLILHSEDRLHIVLQLDVSLFGLGESLSFTFTLVDVVIG